VNKFVTCCLLVSRCLTCHKVPSYVTDRLFSTIEDRLRIPWKGGAICLPPDVVCPILLVPCAILLASLGPAWTIVAFGGTYGLLFIFYRRWRRRQLGGRRTRVFFIFGIASIATMYYTFLSVVVGYREIFLWEILLLSVMLAAMVYFLFQARRDPGTIRSELPSSPSRSRQYSQSEAHLNLSEFEVVWTDSRPIRSMFHLHTYVVNALWHFWRFVTPY